MKKFKLNEDEICKHYVNGMILKELSKKYNVSNNTINRILQKNNISRRHSHNIYTLDENYFHFIDCAEKAYIIGLLYADGSISKKGYNIKITLQEKDKHIIEHINMLLKSNRSLIFSKKQQQSHQNYYGLSISNKIMCNDLITHGIIPNKTFTLKFPTNIKNEFMFDFIRGYFDGDGCFYQDKRRKRVGGWSITGNKNFCEKLGEFLLKNNIKNQIYVNLKRNTEIVELRVSKFENIYKIFNLMYENSTIHLIRKYNKLLEFVSIV